MTAVEWFYENVIQFLGTNPILDNKFEQAKQMEKEEQDKIYDHAFNYGQLSTPVLSGEKPTWEDVRKAFVSGHSFCRCVSDLNIDALAKAEEIVEKLKLKKDNGTICKSNI